MNKHELTRTLGRLLAAEDQNTTRDARRPGCTGFNRREQSERREEGGPRKGAKTKGTRIALIFTIQKGTKGTKGIENEDEDEDQMNLPSRDLGEDAGAFAAVAFVNVLEDGRAFLLVQVGRVLPGEAGVEGVFNG